MTNQKTEINIKKKYLIIGIFSILLSFSSLFVYQFFGNWSWMNYVESEPNAKYVKPNYVWFYQSPFEDVGRVEIKVQPDLNHPQDVETVEKLKVYLNTTMQHTDYILMLALAYFVLILVFKKYKFKLI